MRWLAVAVAALSAVACGGASRGGDDLGGGDVDLAVGESADLRRADLTSGGSASEILGSLTGTCPLLGSELLAPDPSLYFDTLVFANGESYAKSSLSMGGAVLFDTPNAGGSSTESEVMSFEVLHFCEGATLLQTETGIEYDAAVDGGMNSITDILVEIDGKKVGVSVTRAYKPPSQGPQTDSELKALLEKKLAGINASSARVKPAYKWVKQILHVFSFSADSTAAIDRVWPTIDSTLRADTIVLVTTTTGGGFVYCDPEPPLGQECP